MVVGQRSVRITWGGRSSRTRLQGIQPPKPLRYSRVLSPELPPPQGDLGHVEQARLFHLLGSGARGISKPPSAPHSPHGFPKGGVVSQE